MTSISPEQFWSCCLSRLATDLSPQQFKTWINPLVCYTDADIVSVYAPNQFSLQFIRDRFLTKIRSYAIELLGENSKVELFVNPNVPKQELEIDNAKEISSADEKKINASHINKKIEVKKLIQNDNTLLNKNYTFDNLVTGKANQLACAAATQISENIGTAYNPFFVYGCVGLGKTHLIQAIGNAVRQAKPEAKIRYIHAERYVSDMVKAYRHKAFDEFKRFYDSLDLLLIDDIQFFSGKEGTQEAFFYAYNSLIENQRQLVITSDRYPKEIIGIDDRLISRFSWGLTVMLEPPELEMRVAILDKKAAMEGHKLDTNVSFFIAKHIRSNIRELEGALKRVLAYSRFIKQPITLELAKESLKDILAVSKKSISIENIQKTVADFYKIKIIDMHSKKRTREIARPRQIAMSLAKDITQMSLPSIGAAFGDRDHTTVLHACKAIAKLRQTDSVLNHDYNALHLILRN